MLWAIFIEQRLTFGLVLGWLAILLEKKLGVIMSNLWGQFFHLFRDRTKNLHKMKIKETIFFHENLIRNFWYRNVANSPLFNIGTFWPKDAVHKHQFPLHKPSENPWECYPPGNLCVMTLNAGAICFLMAGSVGQLNVSNS